MEISLADPLALRKFLGLAPLNSTTQARRVKFSRTTAKHGTTRKASRSLRNKWLMATMVNKLLFSFLLGTRTRLRSAFRFPLDFQTKNPLMPSRQVQPLALVVPL